jgi:hypothetical protein
MTEHALAEHDPLFAASWEVASEYITSAMTPEELETVADNLNQGASIDRALRQIKPLHAKLRRTKGAWQLHAVKAALRNLNKTTEFTAYRTAMLEANTVSIHDWNTSMLPRAQARVSELMDNEDPRIAFKAADSILKRADSQEGEHDHRERTSTTARNAAAAVQVLVASLGPTPDAPRPPDGPDGGTVVELQPGVGRVGRPRLTALPTKSETLADAPEPGEGETGGRRGARREE